ncbi:hypothetical protein POX_d05458 [Penicillium oxalicum]|nr:hypothetical protein POX_d05458 [Penicillium oxalicum]KAI2789957.1 hypothetical protein POX_d05458 [Penicillium oxalicum]
MDVAEMRGAERRDRKSMKSWDEMTSQYLLNLREYLQTRLSSKSK